MSEAFSPQHKDHWDKITTAGANTSLIKLLWCDRTLCAFLDALFLSCLVAFHFFTKEFSCQRVSCFLVEEMKENKPLQNGTCEISSWLSPSLVNLAITFSLLWTSFNPHKEPRDFVTNCDKFNGSTKILNKERGCEWHDCNFSNPFSIKRFREMQWCFTCAQSSSDNSSRWKSDDRSSWLSNHQQKCHSGVVQQPSFICCQNHVFFHGNNHKDSSICFSLSCMWWMQMNLLWCGVSVMNFSLNKNCNPHFFLAKKWMLCMSDLICSWCKCDCIVVLQSSSFSGLSSGKLCVIWIFFVRIVLTGKIFNDFTWNTRVRIAWALCWLGAPLCERAKKLHRRKPKQLLTKVFCCLTWTFLWKPTFGCVSSWKEFCNQMSVEVDKWGKVSLMSEMVWSCAKNMETQQKFCEHISMDMIICCISLKNTHTFQVRVSC